MKLKGVVLGLLFTLIAVTMVSAVASALVKTETVSVHADDTMKFDMQLKGGQRVYWEWTAEGESMNAVDVDFYIIGPSGDVISSVQGKASDEGNAYITTGDKYTFKWDNSGDAITLAYTITYEPYDQSDMGCCCCGGGMMVLLILGCMVPLIVIKKRRGK
jgi:hypothetical protein